MDKKTQTYTYPHTHILDGFKEHLKQKNQSQMTIQTYSSHIEKFLEWFSQKDIDELKNITKDHIHDYHFEIRNKGYSINTIHLKLRSLKRFFEYLEKEFIIFMNPCEGIRLPKLSHTLPPNVLSFDEIQKVFNSPDLNTKLGKRDRSILELLYSTGIRRNECCHLKMNDVDMSSGIIRINRGKGNKERMIPIGKTAVHCLKEYLLKVRPLYKTDHDYLFITFYGTPMSLQSLGKLIEKYGKRAGIEKSVSTHTLRRTFATHLLKNEAHPMYVQRMLGHSHSKTLSHYIHLAGVDLKKVHQRTHPREKHVR